LFTPKEVDLLN